jgi:hypothetical protein
MTDRTPLFFDGIEDTLLYLISEKKLDCKERLTLKYIFQTYKNIYHKHRVNIFMFNSVPTSEKNCNILSITKHKLSLSLPLPSQ